MNQPELTRTGNTFLYKAGSGVEVLMERLHIGANHKYISEMSVYRNNGHGKELLNTGDVGLTAPRNRSDFAKTLIEYDPDYDWNDLVKWCCVLTLEQIRQGAPLEKLGDEPEKKTTDYLLDPILERNQATTIFAPGGSGKSYLADYIAVLVTYGKMGIYQWLPEMGTALICDWETTADVHKRRVWAIKQGLGIMSPDHVLYRFYSEPLVNIIEDLQKVVAQNDVDLVIVDSQMAASGQGVDPAITAGAYYNALRSLGCTTLTVDHTPKNTEGNMPYGSVVKWNRARSIWEIDGDPIEGEKALEITMFHRKHNEGMLHNPYGIKINFIMDKSELLEVKFQQLDVKEHIKFSGKLNMRDQLVGVLRHGPMNVKELAERFEKSEDNIRAILNRHKAHFINTEKGWGIITDTNET